MTYALPPFTVDPGRLAVWLRRHPFSRTDLAPYVRNANWSRGRYIYVPRRGAKHLFVAHADTVQIPAVFGMSRDPATGNRLFQASGLDDRLGCYLAAYLSRQYRADLLITDHEEAMASTACYFPFPKNRYHFVVEFDRMGYDVVTYDLHSPAFRDALRNYFEIGIGSYSDICSLEDPDCCCVNVGVGYSRPHSPQDWVDLDRLNVQLRVFDEFMQDFGATRFPYDPAIAEQLHYLYCYLCGAEYCLSDHVWPDKPNRFLFDAQEEYCPDCIALYEHRSG